MFQPLDAVIIPEHGWINAIRTALKMSLRQLAERMNITAQSLNKIEQREASGAVTLNTLKDAAKALDMKLVYGFIPKEDSIEKMVEKRAREIAAEIVLRTSNTMRLENQENSDKRINKSIKNKVDEIITTMPKYLWD